MPRPRHLLTAACFVFLAGMLAACVPYYSARPWNVSDAILSELLSPTDNPHGYGAAVAGAALAALLLVPLVPVLRRFSRAGAYLFAAGLGSCLAIGALAPFSEDYSPTHVHLAYATFIFSTAGILVCSFAVWRAGKHRLLLGSIVVQACVLVFLFYLFLGPEFFPPGTPWWRSLALCEWSLCFGTAVFLRVLLFSIDKIVLDSLT